MKCQITSAHEWVYYAVEGAVRNVARHHPDWKLSRDKARSIAKRAAGTLTAESSWPKALAADLPSEKAESRTSIGIWPPPSRFARDRTGSSQRSGPGSGAHKGERRALRRSPLSKAWKLLSTKVGEAKRNGQTERAEALIEALRAIDKCLT